MNSQEEYLPADYACWFEEVGRAQRDIMWLFQRLCEEDRPFLMLNFKSSHLQRGFNIHNSYSNEVRTLVNDAGFQYNIGSFVIRKNYGAFATHGWAPEGRVEGTNRIDFIAILRLVESGKANVFEFIEEQEPEADDKNLLHGPG